MLARMESLSHGFGVLVGLHYALKHELLDLIKALLDDGGLGIGHQRQHGREPDLVERGVRRVMSHQIPQSDHGLHDRHTAISW